jgi:LacI family transcriptional regulator
MNVTLKQLAAELNVSPATVSLALRGVPGTSPETVRRVRELAARHDYVQSNLGRALQSRRTRLIGYLLPGITRTFFNEILQGAGEETAAHNYGLLVGWVNPGDEHIERQINLLLEKDIDGLIISAKHHLLDHYLPRLNKRGKPVVFCSNNAPAGYVEIITDNRSGGYLAVETLAEYGHRKVIGCTQLMERLEGNREAAKAYGMQIKDYNTAEDAVQILRSERDITGVAAYSDDQALDIIYGLRQHGIRVPEDVSVIGFNGGSLGERPEFQLTTIEQQRLELGKRAVECLISQIENPDYEPLNQYLKPELKIRKTVARINTGGK